MERPAAAMAGKAAGPCFGSSTERFVRIMIYWINDLVTTERSKNITGEVIYIDTGKNVVSLGE